MRSPVQKPPTNDLLASKRLGSGFFFLIAVLFALPLLNVVRNHAVGVHRPSARAFVQPTINYSQNANPSSFAGLERPASSLVQLARNDSDALPQAGRGELAKGGAANAGNIPVLENGRPATLIESRASGEVTPGHQATLLNVSYDVTREFYQDYNKDFARYWNEKTGEIVTVNQSHGGSSKQARSVSDGLEADVVTMNQPLDIDILHERGNLVPEDWSARLPNKSTPYNSTILFVVRKGNPRNIKDWPDLIRTNVSVIIPHPKTSGNGRYSYLAAWGYAWKKSSGDESSAREFVAKLFANVPVLDVGGRGATTTFAERGVGDVLLTFENEAAQTVEESGGKFEIIVPSISVLTENPVAWVDRFVKKHGTETLARAYLEYLYTDAGQELAAKYHFRPTNKTILAKHTDEFQPLELFTVEEVAGGWQKAYRTHFADGGLFDELYQSRR
jgi:sulfate transport system substrate-binding protein